MKLKQGDARGMVMQEIQAESLEGVWGEIEPELRERLGSDRYDRWLAPLRVIAAGGDEVRLGAPNKFWLEWIEDKYLQAVTAVLVRRAGRSLRVSLSIDPELFMRMRRSQQEILADTKQSPPENPEVNQQGVARQRQRHSTGKATSRSTEIRTLDNFVVGPSNRMAHTAALRIVEAPGSLFNPFFVHGGCGLGKTHLLRGIWRAIRTRQPDLPARYLTGEQFLNQYVASLRAGNTSQFRERLRAPQVLLIDDIQLLSSKDRTQEEFLHTFNALVDGGHQVVLSSDSHPKRIARLQNALVGRFLSGLVVTMVRPEFETRLEILRRRALRSRVQFSEVLLRLLAEKIRSSVRELLGGFNVLEEVSYQEGRQLDPREAEAILPESLCGEWRRLRLSQIAECVGRRFGIPLSTLTSASRRRSLTQARQVAMFLCRKYTDHSLAEIGKYFGDRNHSSVKSAEAKVESLRQTNPALARDLENIIDSFQE